MPAIKLLLRRTLASTTIKALSPPSMASLSVPSSGSPSTRRILAQTTHFKNPSMIKINPNNKIVVNNKTKNGVFLLSCCSRLHYSSSFIKGEERESVNKGDKFSLPSSSSFVTEMGFESDNNNNGNQKGVVSSSKNEDQKEKEEEEKSSKLLTLPTVLTLARVMAVPIFVATFYADSWWGPAATTSIFVVASLTDWLDGYLARKMRQGTTFGAFLDPVADKLMVATTLVLLCSRPPEDFLYENHPWLLPVPAIAIIGREITMSAVREWAASQDAKLLQAVAVNNLGKWKTATQMVALTLILVTRDNSISSQGGLATSGVGLLYISAGLAGWSLIVYMRKIWKVLLR